MTLRNRAGFCRTGCCRTNFYGAALVLALFAVAGCGKPQAPPPGAPKDVSVPTIDQGTESAPQDSTTPGEGAKDSPANPELSPPGAGTPQGEAGEPK